MTKLLPQYDPKSVEKRIYEGWENSGAFTPSIDKTKKPFVVMIPPPNVTGVLHMGHALNNTIIDILIRFNRMKGVPSLYLPGMDHAGIATQNVVEKQLAKEGKTRHDLGREKFIEKVWEWKKEYGGIILSQLRSLGCSCDWTRERFTMDAGYLEAVKTAFIKYYENGLIYRGSRVVNWCVRCGTSISDIELEYKEEPGQLWYIKYPIKKDPNNKSQIEFITVATTRPETMLGDTAVAVNSNDKRYKHLIGRTVILPITGREIPIIGDDVIDIKFGAGVLKVTPSHDIIDAEIGERHKLPFILVIGEDGKMTIETGRDYQGLSVSQAREKVLKKLKTLGLIEKIENISHNVANCSRCGTVIEPLVSKQWFVKMKPLAALAIKSYESEINYYPSSHKKVALTWLENIRDWNISRQIWWGHRLPVYFCQNNPNGEIRMTNDKSKNRNLKLETKNYIVAMEKPDICPFCGECEMAQSQDVLDTWFSSALWPFATLGWPKETEDLNYFYPGSVLATGRDIIHLWVTRMIYSGIYFISEKPFKDVIIHATVQTREGRRMSKSLGTGVDPMGLIEKYGADATRFGLVMQAAKGQDMRFGEDYLLSARNFANKLWNIARFIESQELGEIDLNKVPAVSTLSEKWILSLFSKTIKNIEKYLKGFEFSEAAHELYSFVWENLADWYLEISKIKGQGLNTQLLPWIFGNSLKILHPFMPFITEELFAIIYYKKLIVSNWPEFDYKEISVEKEFELLKELITGIRIARAEQKLNPTQELHLKISAGKFLNIFKENISIIEKIAKVKVEIAEKIVQPKASLQVHIQGADAYLVLADFIDLEKEKVRLQKEISELKIYLKATELRIKNKKFLDSAPAEIIKQSRDSANKTAEKIEKLSEFFKSL